MSLKHTTQGVINDHHSVRAARHGTSCPPGTVYNPQTGECEGDPCEPKAGQSTTHFHNAGPLGGTPIEPPGSICDNACQYAYSFEQPTKCERFANGPSNDVFCSFRYQANGISCPTDTPDPTKPSRQSPPPSEPTLDETQDCSQWQTQADGSLKRTCTSQKTFKEPGKLDCPAGVTCTSGKPSPLLEKTDKTEETIKTTEPDGSTGTTTKETTETTKCAGAKPCSTDTTDKTTDTKTGADGIPTEQNSTCKGSGCNANDGNDDKEEEEKEEEEEEERTAAPGACDAGFSCSGDAIDCEVLKKQKEQLCFAEEQADFDAKKADIEGLFEGEKFKVDEGSGQIEAPSFINKGTRFLPATCPADQTFSLTTGGGRSFALSYEPLCRAASDLSGLLVAVTGIFCALYVGRSVGGQ